MINSSISVDQEKRQRQELKIVSSELELNTDLYSEGYFEGYIGPEPNRPQDCSYWAGYQLGSREYWAKKLGVETPIKF